MSAAKYVVCPACEGEGFVGTLGAYTADEFEQSFEDFDEYVDMHEASKVSCPCCKGKRVATAEDIERWEDDIEYAREVAAESGYFGGRY